MTIIEEIYAALLLAKPGDLSEVEKYIKWILVRRRVNQHFYFSAHWVSPTQTHRIAPAAKLPAPRAHWVR